MTEPNLFKDFDSKSGFKECIDKAQSSNSRNFVLDFDAENARCAFDFDKDGINSLLTKRPEKQQDIIKCLGRHYGISPRIQSSMHSSPLLSGPIEEKKPTPVQAPHGLRHIAAYKEHRDAERKKAAEVKENDVVDVEKGIGSLSKISSKNKRVSHYDIVNNVWHFTSVDFGRKYTCIGYNSIFDMTVSQGKTEGEKDGDSGDGFQSNKPGGKRVWTWLLLGYDRTVISIQENPFAESEPDINLLSSIRRNLISVFRQLSTQGESEEFILKVNVRPSRKSEEPDDSPTLEEDSPSLLLYYLFDDWFTTYALVSRDAHQYGVHLDQVRLEMFASAQLKHVQTLHHFGRQLAILKRLYQSYNLIIERITTGPQSSVESRYKSLEKPSAQPDASQNASQSQGYGVPIAPAAALRFERLKDRINLLALSEISACLEEKESLMALNFNLITIKESSYVEKLTRITILLAKATILFLPVSVMSTYFTVPLDQVTYTASSYWIAFTVILVLSFLGLLIFGKVSGTVESKPIYTSLTRAAIDGWRNFARRKTQKGKKR